MVSPLEDSIHPIDKGAPIALTGIYIHFPFCERKCLYCSFSSYEGLKDLIPPYLKALKEEIHLKALGFPPPGSLYIGGGTPSLLIPQQLDDLVRTLDKCFPLSSIRELTLEANPSSLTRAKLAGFKQAGVTRLSLGVQSLNGKDLKTLGRLHSPHEAINAYHLSREAGFEDISLDLIFALPSQGLKGFMRSLSSACSLEPDHISLYCLAWEEGTPFHDLWLKGALKRASEELEAKMYEEAIALLKAWGYEHYEISNFARNGKRSLHNQLYWHNHEYLGQGAGATSYLGKRRWKNPSNPLEYIEALSHGRSLVLEEVEETQPTLEMAETVMQGLRLVEGLNKRAFYERFGLRLREIFNRQISNFKGLGLLEETRSHLRLTPKGLLLHNEVAMAFLP